MRLIIVLLIAFSFSLSGQHISTWYDSIPGLKERHEYNLKTFGEPTEIIIMEDAIENHIPDSAWIGIGEVIKTDGVFYVYNGDIYDRTSFMYGHQVNKKKDFSHLTKEEKRGKNLLELNKMAKVVWFSRLANYASGKSKRTLQKYLPAIQNGLRVSWGEVEEEELPRLFIIEIYDLTYDDVSRLGYIFEMLRAEGVKFREKK